MIPTQLTIFLVQQALIQKYDISKFRYVKLKNKDDNPRLDILIKDVCIRLNVVKAIEHYDNMIDVMDCIYMAVEKIWRDSLYRPTP